MTAFIGRVEQQWGISIANYDDLYGWTIDKPEQFWVTLWDFVGIVAEIRGERIVTDFDSMIDARFFPDARLNFAENLMQCQDKAPAIISLCEDFRHRVVSYQELHRQVSRIRQAMEAVGIGIGSKVAAVLPNVPEALFCMLATNSLGAIWTQCSPDFGTRGIIDRIGQVGPELLFVTDAYSYKGRQQQVLSDLPLLSDTMLGLKQIVLLPFQETSVKVKGSSVPIVAFDDFISHYSATGIDFVRLPFNHPSFILYTSGTTGQPKCIVHSAGGVLLQLLKEHYLHFDLKPGGRFFFHTTTGWNMWYTLVSALGAGGVVCMYEGAPFFPSTGRLFDFVAEERISVLGISPKFVDVLERNGFRPKTGRDLTCLDTILTTGAPLLPHHFDYLYREVGESIRVSSISGGTEIMTTFANGNPIGPVYNGEMQCRSLGMKVEVFNEKGRAVKGEKGELVCTAPFPSRPDSFVNDPNNERYHDTYFSRFPNVWTHGDLAEITTHNGLIIFGRSDAVLNRGGVRIGTAEIYRPLNHLEEIADAIVVGKESSGDIEILLFVQLVRGVSLDDALIRRIKERIRQDTTHRHVPDEVIAVEEIPYTVNGKKGEVAVRDILHARPVKNTGSLANPESLKQFVKLARSQ